MITAYDPSRNWFRRQRKRLDLTIREMAVRCNVTEGTVRNWETANASPQPWQAQELAAAYEVELAIIALELVKLAVLIHNESKARAA